MSRPRLLLIDDEDAFRETVDKLLTFRGFDVSTASDGAQGMRAVLRGGIEIVILDVKMPGLDGIETLRELKRIQPDLEVIILTGHLLKSTEQEGLKLGAFAYLTKPCTVPDLVSVIGAALETRARRLAGPDSPPELPGSRPAS
ncbi:MAG: response regulator [Acidobacteria bacterium]|nr:response regulator [Acidobacteriota bacterium]